MPAIAALARAGFSRYATYRQATLAAIFTNSVFGVLRTYVMLAALGASTAVGGYDRQQLVTYVWVGQGVFGVVLLWGGTDLAERIRSGDVVLDLLRPLDPLWIHLAADLGRAAHAALTRIVVPVVLGYLLFDAFVPRRPVTVPLFAVSLTLGVVISFALRYLASLCGFWMLDIRGVLAAFATAGRSSAASSSRCTSTRRRCSRWCGRPRSRRFLQMPLDVRVSADRPGWSAVRRCG